MPRWPPIQTVTFGIATFSGAAGQHVITRKTQVRLLVAVDAGRGVIGFDHRDYLFGKRFYFLFVERHKSILLQNFTVFLCELCGFA